MVLPYVAEQRQGIPDTGGLRTLRDRDAGLGGAVSAVRLRASLHVVRPADVRGGEQPGDVGPGQVDRRPAGCLLAPDGPADLADRVRPDDGIDAANRGASNALGRPAGD